MARLALNRRNLALAVLLSGTVGLSGCGGVDLDVDAPILEAAGINLNSKKVEEDLPERPGIVIPPSTEKLPEPGTKTAIASQREAAWPQDPDKIKARSEAEKKAAYEKYCREGDWSSDAGIDEFEKNFGDRQRCPSKLGKAISKSLGGGEASSDSSSGY